MTDHSFVLNVQVYSCVAQTTGALHTITAAWACVSQSVKCVLHKHKLKYTVCHIRSRFIYVFMQREERHWSNKSCSYLCSDPVQHSVAASDHIHASRLNGCWWCEFLQTTDMLKLYISLCCNFTYLKFKCYVLTTLCLWSTFRHNAILEIIRKKSGLGLNCMVLSPETQLENVESSPSICHVVYKCWNAVSNCGHWLDT